VTSIADSWDWGDAHELGKYLCRLDMALEKSIVVLQWCGISRHEAMDQVVFAFEPSMSMIGDVIERLKVTLDATKRLTGRLVLLTRQLIDQLEAGCKILQLMDRIIKLEDEIQRRQRECRARRKSLDPVVWWRKPGMQFES